MAVKFSQFVVETDKANVNYLVGWDGTENVQITPADLLSGTPSGSGATGQVAFFDSASTLAGDNDLYWNNTNKRLGIGISSPNRLLHVNSNGQTDIHLTTNSQGTSASDGMTVFLDAAGSGGLWLRENADMRFATSGTERMRITSGGNVGIGTNSPAAKLEVDGTLIATGISQLGSGGNNVYLTSSSAGNVGIGTSGPTYKLHVDSSITPMAKFEGTNNAYVDFTDPSSSVRLQNSGHSFFGTQTNTDLRFKTNGTVKMSIQNSGNVGIGTTSPQTKLHVSGGQALFASDTAVNPILPFGIEVYRNTGGNSNVLIHQDDGNHEAVLHMRCGGNDTKIKTGPNTWALKIDTETITDAIALMSTSGNLGIGTTSPAAKLDVVGRIGLNDGNNNVSVGDGAGEAITTGTHNVLLGGSAGDALTTGSANIAIGYEALSTEDGHSQNVAIGYQALKMLNAGTAGLNVAVGHQAGTAMLTGVKNALLGGLAGDALTTGSNNVAIGYEALSSEDTGSRNVAIGQSALGSLNYNGDGYNIAIGHNAGAAATGAIDNVIIGGLAGDALTGGSYNVAIGKEALSSENDHGRNVAIGYRALRDQDAGTNAFNVAIGFDTGSVITTGIENVLMGGNTGLALTTGTRNVAIGHAALQAEDAYGYNVAIGNRALQSQNANSDAYNVAVGSNAGQAVTTGINNTLIGGQAGDAITTGASNVAIGKEALTSNVTSGRNVAIGQAALRDMDNAGSAYNIGIGYVAGQNVTSGTSNVIVGGLAGDAITVGSGNIVLGFGALTNETHGRNVAIGYQALGTQNVGSDAYNVAVGYQAGNDITTGANNTIIGGLAGDTLTTGSNNVVVGYEAADDLLDGIQNTLIGDQVAGALTSGDENTYIGRRAASTATTGNQNVAIGAGASLSSATVSNEVNISNSSVIARFQGAASSWSFVSDARDKKEIEDLSLGVEFINKLKPRKFKWDLRDSDVDKDKEASGFVAQEIQEILDETGVDYTGIVDTNNPDQYTVAQANIIPMLVKAIQELSAEVKELKSKI